MVAEFLWVSQTPEPGELRYVPCTLRGHSNRKEFPNPQCRWKVEVSGEDVFFPPPNCLKFPSTPMGLHKSGALRSSERWALEADDLVPRCALVGIAAYNTLWVKRIFRAWLSLLRALRGFLCWGLEISKGWGVGGGQDYRHAVWRGQEDRSNRLGIYHLCSWMAPGQRASVAWECQFRKIKCRRKFRCCRCRLTGTKETVIRGNSSSWSCIDGEVCL